MKWFENPIQPSDTNNMDLTVGQRWKWMISGYKMQISKQNTG